MVHRGRSPASRAASWRSLSAALGIELEPAAGAAPEGLAQLIAGPEAHSPFGLVQQLGAGAGTELVGDAAAGEHIDDLGRAADPLDLEAPDARRHDQPVP
jgi:hypothetical protein